MFKPCIAAAVLGVLLPAQESGDTFSVPGTNVQTRTVHDAGKTFGEVSRDRGETWSRLAEVDTDLHLRFGRFDPRVLPVIPKGFEASPTNRLFIVQFHTQIIGEFRAALTGLGVELHHYLPSQSYLVRMDRNLLGRVQGLPFVRSVIEYHTAFRIDPDFLVGLGTETAARRYSIVFVDKRRDALDLEARVVALGGRRETSSGGGIRFEATLTGPQLIAIARDDRTLFIDAAATVEFDVDNARIQGGTDYVETKAGIQGIGMVGHLSEGIHSTHTEFAAISGVRGAPIGLFGTTASSHGTNTAGIIYARGVSPIYRGLMPNAQVTFTDSGAAGSNRYGMTQSMQLNQRVMLDTASWGGGRTLNYTSVSAEMDNIIFELDMFITQSQSNAGATSQPRSSRPQAWAKNICSIGGFRHGNNANPADDYWGRSGSTGPASDGRIGVTLSGYYDSIRTTSGSSGYSTSFGGTSGATPICNGLGGNMIEMFTDGLFGYGKVGAKTAVERFKYLPHFSTTKMLLVATANQVTWNASGVSVGANRYQQGFGFPSLTRAYDERDRMLVIDELDVLTQGQSRVYYLFARGGRLTAAMSYSDPEAASNASIHRINSVDLKVETSDGTSYWGNNGLLSGPQSTPGGSANDRDTEEVVSLGNAPEGLTTVTVQATGVRKDGHAETSAVDVDFALVVEGLTGMRDTSSLALDLDSKGPGDLTATVGSVPTGWDQGFTLFSLATKRTVSTGNVLGLEFDGLATSIISMPMAAGNVFHFSPGTASEYPNAPFVFPVGLAGALKGVTIDGVVFLMKGAKVVAASNVDRVEVK